MKNNYLTFNDRRNRGYTYCINTSQHNYTHIEHQHFLAFDSKYFMLLNWITNNCKEKKKLPVANT